MGQHMAATTGTAVVARAGGHDIFADSRWINGIFTGVVDTVLQEHLSAVSPADQQFVVGLISENISDQVQLRIALDDRANVSTNRNTLAAVLVLGITMAMSARAERDATVCRVRVDVTDSYGHPLSDARIKVLGLGVAIDTTGHDVLELRRGTYNVVVEVPGFDTFRGTFTADQREQVLSVGMRLGAYEAPKAFCSIDGRVDPVQSGIRIRLMTIFGPDVRDVLTKSNGVFQFENLECGSYLLLGVHGGQCVGMAFASVTDQRTRITLSVSKGLAPCSIDRSSVTGKR